MKKGVSYRRIYPYKCSKCGEKRKTLIYSRLQGGVCHKCRLSEAVKNQIALFPEPSQETIEVNKMMEQNQKNILSAVGVKNAFLNIIKPKPTK